MRAGVSGYDIDAVSTRQLASKCEVNLSQTVSESCLNGGLSQVRFQETAYLIVCLK
jgi:hypothetical protein